MTETARVRRAVDGILLLDKPLGLSSNAALQRAKWLFQAKKAGHTGSLDPLASGMLPVCFGEATKFSHYLLDADKTYLVQAQLGVRTSSGDGEGEIISERPVPTLAVAELERALDTFRGDSWQVPSMFSALKHRGKPLYEFARRGITVERPARAITVHDLQVKSYTAPMLTFELRCSKGTYVRNVVDDLGELLGCGAYVTELRRLAVGDFAATAMVTLEQLIECQDNPTALASYLVPLQQLLSHLPVVTITTGMAFYLQRGQPIQIPHTPAANGLIVIQLNSGEFLGVGEIQDNGLVAPRRLIAHASESITDPVL